MIKSDPQLQRQLASDMFSRGTIGKLMNDKERREMLNLALDNPQFFEASANQGNVRKDMLELMKKDPVLSRFYRANEQKILSSLG